MTKIEIKPLLEAGVHFGHLTRKWNPNMAPFIHMEKNGIHIINLYTCNSYWTSVRSRIDQSTISLFCSWRNLFAFEKCLQPKKPVLAENGDGCGADITKCFDSMWLRETLNDMFDANVDDDYRTDSNNRLGLY